MFLSASNHFNLHLKGKPPMQEIFQFTLLGSLLYPLGYLYEWLQCNKSHLKFLSRAIIVIPLVHLPVPKRNNCIGIIIPLFLKLSPEVCDAVSLPTI